MKKAIYLTLAIVGIIGPMTQFVPWSNANGFNIKLLIDQMFANQIASGIALDALIAALAIIVFIILDNQKSQVRYYWVAILSIFLSGIAFALPFYLYLRERAIKNS